VQAENWSIQTFLERTDALAAERGISLRALAPAMGLSVASLFGYRNGSIPISRKAWAKLEQAERGDLDKDAASAGAPEDPNDGDEIALLKRIALALERIATAMERAGPKVVPMPGMKMPGAMVAETSEPASAEATESRKKVTYQDTKKK
jgi:hypothetical protein